MLMDGTLMEMKTKKFQEKTMKILCPEYQKEEPQN